MDDFSLMVNNALTLGIFIRSVEQNDLEISMLWENPSLGIVLRLLKHNKFVKFSIRSVSFERIEKSYDVNVNVNDERSYKLKMKQGILVQNPEFDKLLNDKDLVPFAKPIESVGTTVGTLPSLTPDIEIATDKCRKTYTYTGTKLGAAMGAGIGMVSGAAAGGAAGGRKAGGEGAFHGAVAGGQAGGIIVGALGGILGGLIGSGLGSLLCPPRMLNE
jgi:hypothetical protein